MEQIIEQDNNNELDTIADTEISPRTYSLVWKHFRIESEKAKCIYCSIEYKRTSGATSNLHRHLKNKHPAKLEKLETKGAMDKYINKIPSVSLI